MKGDEISIRKYTKNVGNITTKNNEALEFH